MLAVLALYLVQLVLLARLIFQLNDLFMVLPLLSALLKYTFTN